MGFLSDIFLLPHWFLNYRAAFSIGDLILSVERLYLWSLGGPAPIHTAEVEHVESIISTHPLESTEKSNREISRILSAAVINEVSVLPF